MQTKKIKINGVSLRVTRKGKIIMEKRTLADGRIQKQRICKPQNIGRGYTQIGIMNKANHPKQKFFLVSRIVALAWLPNPENLPCVDHIDGNPKNNCAGNLRWVSHSCNSRGYQKKRNGCTSKFRGVSKQKNSEKWVARIKAGSKRIYLGLFEEEGEAAKAYNAAAIKNGFPKQSLNIV